MKRINANKFVTTKRKNESVEDPHELLLSLVDMGSLDADEALLACVQEMSDAECKRVLGSLSLPSCCDNSDEVTVEDPAEDELDTALDNDEDESAEDDDFVLEDEDEDESDEDDTEDVEECDNRARELEARICRLEKSLRSESMNRNRISRFSRRKTNR